MRKVADGGAVAVFQHDKGAYEVGALIAASAFRTVAGDAFGRIEGLAPVGGLDIDDVRIVGPGADKAYTACSGGPGAAPGSMRARREAQARNISAFTDETVVPSASAIWR